MSISKVSTAELFRGMTENIALSQKQVYKISEQVSSEEKYQTYLDMEKDGDVYNVLSMEEQLQSVMNYSQNNNMILDRLLSYDVALDQLEQVADRVISEIIIRRSALGQSEQLATLANSALSQVENLLNSSFENRYLFAGSITNTVPVSALVNNTNIIDGVPTANYYQGDDFQFVQYVSDDQSITYNITADNNAFQQLIGALNLAITGDQQNSDSYISQASNLLNTASQSLAQLRANLGDNMQVIKQQNKTNTHYRAFLNDSIQDKTKTKIPEAMMELSRLTLILQGSFGTASRILSCSMVEYI